MLKPTKTITAKLVKPDEGEPFVELHDNLSADTWKMSVPEFEAQYYTLVIEG